MSISDGESELTVLTDRAQGGTSMNSGQVELMVHRRLLHDDAFGVGEALNEVAFGAGLVARGHHWILAGNEEFPLFTKPSYKFIFLNSFWTISLNKSYHNLF